MDLTLVFLVVSIILCGLAAAGVNSKIGLGWLGVAFFAASFLPV